MEKGKAPSPLPTAASPKTALRNQVISILKPFLHDDANKAQKETFYSVAQHSVTAVNKNPIASPELQCLGEQFGSVAALPVTNEQKGEMFRPLAAQYVSDKAAVESPLHDLRKELFDPEPQQPFLPMVTGSIKKEESCPDVVVAVQSFQSAKNNHHYSACEPVAVEPRNKTGFLPSVKCQGDSFEFFSPAEARFSIGPYWKSRGYAKGKSHM